MRTLAPPTGKIIASSQPGSYPNAVGASGASGLVPTPSPMPVRGDDCVDDIYTCSLHHNKLMSVYSASVRKGGDLVGETLGVLGVYFDWEGQSRTIVKDEPNLSAEEWKKATATGCGPAHHRQFGRAEPVLVKFPLSSAGQTKGAYSDNKGKPCRLREDHRLSGI